MKFTEITIKNDVYNEKLIIPYSQKNIEIKEAEEGSLLDRLRKEKSNIFEKFYGDISSFNFKREVFFSNKWNELSKIARGLFLNNQTGEIVARGYDKFFNYKEGHYNTEQFLKNNLVFPVKVYKKYNGFLGILSVFNDNFVFHTKSTVDGDYSQYFKAIFMNEEHGSHEDLKRFMLDNHVCLIFEVVDKDNDPHIVKYNENHIVLLDAIFLEESFKNINYETLINIGKRFNFQVKEQEYEFLDYKSLINFIQEQEQDMINQKEGYVLVDNNNYHFKLKCKWYKVWKLLRGLKDKVGKKRQFSASCLTVPVMNEFISWCKQQDSEYLINTDIITLRDKFYEEYHRK